MVAYLCALVLVLPWLNPIAIGPWPQVWPWLVTAACGTFWIALREVDRNAVVRSAFPAWTTAAVLSALIGLIQYGGYSHAFAPFINATPALEAFGNLRQRNQFATLMAIGLAVLIWCNTLPDAHKPWHLPTAALLATGMACSVSRTGALELIVLATLSLIWGDHRHRAARKVLIVTLLAYGAASALLPWLAGQGWAMGGMVGRLRSEGPACTSRLALWSNVLHLIALKPWLGWGWGELDYAHFVTLYPGTRFCDILDNAHNLPLHLAVELGIPIAVLACSATGWLIARQHPWKEVDPQRKAAWAILAVILFHSLLEYPLWYGPFQMAVALCILILRRSPATGLAPLPAGHISIWPSVGGLAIPRRMRIVLLGAAMALIAYAGWDYRRVSQLYLPTAARAPAYQDDTLQKAARTWLFRDQVRFAEFTTTALTRENADWVYAAGLRMLHFSPEPRVIESLIASASLLGREEEADFYRTRLRAMFASE